MTFGQITHGTHTIQLSELEQTIFAENWHSDYSRNTYTDFLGECKDAARAARMFGLPSIVADPTGREWVVSAPKEQAED